MPSPDENKKVNEGFFRMLNSEPRNGAGAFLNNYEERMNVQIGSPFLKVLQEEKVEEDTYYNLVCRIDKSIWASMTNQKFWLLERQ
jgi:hypothetical protein